MKADKARIARSIKIARGQLDGILRMIEEDRYCVDNFHQILGDTVDSQKCQPGDSPGAHSRLRPGRVADRRAESQAGGSTCAAGKIDLVTIFSATG